MTKTWRNTAEALVYGSENLDRMEDEILKVMQIMTSLFKNSAPVHAEELGEYLKGCEHDLGSESHTHKTKWTFQTDGSYELKIRCRQMDVRGFEKFGFKNGTRYLKMEDIESVREVLPDFVGAMVKKFPWLEEEMRPILKAAKS